MIEKARNRGYDILLKINDIVSNNPLTVFSIYICTFFVYRDFGVRMFIGYGMLAALLLIIIFDHYYGLRDGTRGKLRLSNIHYSYGLLITMVLLSFIRLKSRHDSNTIVYMIIMIITFGYLIFTKPNKKDVLNSIKVFLIASVLFSVFVLFFQVFRNAYWNFIFPIMTKPSQEQALKYAYKGYSVAIGRSYTYMDYILVSGTFSALSLLVSNAADKSKIVTYKVIFGLTILTVLLVGRRGEFLALIFALVVFYIVSTDKDNRKKRIYITLSVIIGGIALVILLLPVLSQIDALRRYTNSIKSVLYGTHILGGVTSGRVPLYKEAWRIFTENPLLGVGWGSFSEHVDPSILALYKEGLFNVHNCFLQLLAETGLIGSTLIIFPFGYTFYSTIKNSIDLWSGSRSLYDTSVTVSNTFSLLFQTFIFSVALLDPSIYKYYFWVLYFIAVSFEVYSQNKKKI